MGESGGKQLLPVHALLGLLVVGGGAGVRVPVDAVAKEL